MLGNVSVFVEEKKLERFWVSSKKGELYHKPNVGTEYVNMQIPTIFESKAISIVG
jgi:hypothetical protein